MRLNNSQMGTDKNSQIQAMSDESEPPPKIMKIGDGSWYFYIYMY